MALYGLIKGPLATTLPLLCRHIKLTWVVINLGSLLAPWAIMLTMWGIVEVGNVPSCTLAMPPVLSVHGFITKVVYDHKDRRHRFTWVSLSLESKVCLSTSSTRPVLLKTPSCTARIVASRRLSISLQSAISSDLAWRSWNMPAANFNCLTLLWLGILATSISPPASDSNCGSMTKKKKFIFQFYTQFYRLRNAYIR